MANVPLRLAAAGVWSASGTHRSRPAHPTISSLVTTRLARASLRNRRDVVFHQSLAEDEGVDDGT